MIHPADPENMDEAVEWVPCNGDWHPVRRHRNGMWESSVHADLAAEQAAVAFGADPSQVARCVHVVAAANLDGSCDRLTFRALAAGPVLSTDFVDEPDWGFWYRLYREDADNVVRHLLGSTVTEQDPWRWVPVSEDRGVSYDAVKFWSFSQVHDPQMAARWLQAGVRSREVRLYRNRYLPEHVPDNIRQIAWDDPVGWSRAGVAFTSSMAGWWQQCGFRDPLIAAQGFRSVQSVDRVAAASSVSRSVIPSRNKVSV